MYINFKLTLDKGLTPIDITALQIINQNKTEDLGDLIEKNISFIALETYKANSLIESIKRTKKDQSVFSVLRLTSKGKELLEDLQIPEVNDNDLLLYSWLEKIYLKAGKEIGNRKKTKIWISLFRTNSGIEKNELAFLCKNFINDEKQFEFSQRLEYVFFKPTNVFTVKFDLEQSRLYQHYLNNESFFKYSFQKIQNND